MSKSFFQTADCALSTKSKITRVTAGVAVGDGVGLPLPPLLENSQIITPRMINKTTAPMIIHNHGKGFLGGSTFCSGTSTVTTCPSVKSSSGLIAEIASRRNGKDSAGWAVAGVGGFGLLKVTVN